MKYEYYMLMLKPHQCNLFWRFCIKFVLIHASTRRKTTIKFVHFFTDLKNKYVLIPSLDMIIKLTSTKPGTIYFHLNPEYYLILIPLFFYPQKYIS